jgi:threonine/homoserine/homoserine lactone efflux protein
MLDAMPTGAALSAFLLASLLLAVTPGPGVLYITARTVSQGRGAGLASLAGVALGNFGNAVAAALGLAALFAVSALAFSVVKYAGAAYLVWLGVQALRGGRVAAEASQPAAAPPGRIFRQGLLVALLNPKTTIFFASFLPQFVHGTGSPALPCIVLSAVFVLIAALTDLVYVLLAGQLAARLRSPRLATRARWLGAATYFGLGLYTALVSRPGSGAPR